ncbi:hypothetical protein BGO18_00095 [Candidatus Saccharibacteria bacterium 47-87]|nr:hypothetical protein [Candidatus Saccharibacteria bacterium]OJU96590.1 MAG: hypothetical protein BGO18_00095 [Candidatus Saccharibacteria bacterium 47-87]
MALVGKWTIGVEMKHTIKMTIKPFVVAIFSLVFIISSIPLTSTQDTYAKKCDKDFYSNNDVFFYDPCSGSVCSAAGGNLTGPAPTSLTGADNEEKAWNYFTARGLTPVAAAGTMGNIEAESGFRASAVESNGVGLGIIQWSYDRRTKLESAAAAAGVNLSDNDAALLFQLNYLWDGEYGAMTWQEQVNAETTVEGDTTKASFWGSFNNNRSESQAGNGSTMVFHALIERSGDVPTEADRIPGHGVLTHRIDNAKGFLEKYSGGASGSTSSRCGVSGGGLSWDQAVIVAKKLSDDWSTIYCGGDSIKSGFYCDWDSGYCTAGAAWMAVTTAPQPFAVPGIPDGVNVANTLTAINFDVYANAKPDGSNIQPFSIWSFGDGSISGEPGHTGTIVGVGTDGSLISLETNWSGSVPGSTKEFTYNSGHRVAVYQFPSFEAFKNSHNGYVYNNMATPKDSSIAGEMAKKMAKFIGN